MLSLTVISAFISSFHKFANHVSIIIRDFRRIRRHVSLLSAKTISVALINSRLDYCNSFLNNFGKQNLSKLQREQNCLARVIRKTSRFSPSLPLLKQLHWPPVVYRITFKLATVTQRTLSTQQPTYLVNLLHFSDISRTLRSLVSKQRFVPKTKLSIGKRAFSVAAPTLWNQLPITIKCSETIDTFRKKTENNFVWNCFSTTVVPCSNPITSFVCPRVWLAKWFCLFQLWA